LDKFKILSCLCSPISITNITIKQEQKNATKVINEQTQKENDVMARISYCILTMAHLGFFNLHHDIERQMKPIYKV